MVKISENVEGSRATMKGIKRFKRVSSRALWVTIITRTNTSVFFSRESPVFVVNLTMFVMEKVCWVTFNGRLLYFELYIEIKIKLSFYTILTFLDSSMQKMLLLSSFPIYIFFFFSEDDFFRKLAWGFLSASRH